MSDGGGGGGVRTREKKGEEKIGRERKEEIG